LDNSPLIPPVEIYGTLSFAKEGDYTKSLDKGNPKDSDYPVEILRINQPGEK
jgi:hypothetical protein